MGLCETSNSSIFTFSRQLLAIDSLQQLFLSHDEVLRFEWKSLQNDDVTLRYSIQFVVFELQESH